jgi:hypothetical protein
MTSPSRTEPPEAAGPGTDTPSGAVLYGDQGAPGAPAVFDVPLPPLGEPSPRCARCAALPDDLVASLTAALSGKAGVSPR